VKGNHTGIALNYLTTSADICSSWNNDFSLCSRFSAARQRWLQCAVGKSQRYVIAWIYSRRISVFWFVI